MSDTATRAPHKKGTPTNGNRARPAPYDDRIEAQLLGAALLNREARDIVTTLGPTVFYAPRHQHIAAAIAAIHTSPDNKLDAYLVADRLRRDGLLDQAGGFEYLVEINNNVGALSIAAKHGDIIADYARQRRALDLFTRATQAIYDGEDFTAYLTQLDTINDDGTRSSWDEIDLEPVVVADERAHPPEILHRDDGQALIYRGKIHAFNAESETAKTWMALAACIEELTTGHHVVFIDFEDGAEGIVERLEALGVSLALLYGPNRLFHYVRPDDPIDRVAIRRLINLNPTLVVLDGVMEAMSQNGWSIKENDDIALYLGALPRAFARAGAAVIQIDHLVKNRAEQGDDAIGGVMKRTGIDVAYKLERIHPFGRGMSGSSKITTAKDRPGHVRAACVAGKNAGELRLVSTTDGVTLKLVAPSTLEHPEAFRPTVLMERVSRFVEDANTAGETPARNTILAGVQGDKRAKTKAIEILVADGHLTYTVKGQSHLHSSVKPYRETDDPASPSYRPTSEPPTDGDDPSEWDISDG